MGNVGQHRRPLILKRLIDCLGKVTGKLVAKEDADLIVREARAYEAEGLTKVEAERRAVGDALEFAQRSGESLLEQIRANAPDAHSPAIEFWNRQTIRKRGEAPAPAPAVAAPAPTEAAAARPGPAELSDRARQVRDNLPPEQREKAEAAFREATTPDPHPHEVPGLPPVPAHENTSLIAALSKYGLFDPDVTAREVLDRMAADRTQPQWIRTTMDLLNHVGGADNVQIEVVNRPNSGWPALYVYQGSIRPGKILINLAQRSPGTGLGSSIAHEVVHHLTLLNLRFNEDKVPLTDTQRAGKAELKAIFDRVQSIPEFKGEYGVWGGVEEFASEVLANPSLRAKLNAIKAKDSPLTLLQQIRRAIAQLVFGEEGVKAGSLLEEAIRNTLNVAGVRSAAIQSESAASKQQSSERLARLLSAFPSFEKEITGATAPMAQYNMGIESPQERYFDLAEATYSPEERDFLNGKLRDTIKAGKRSFTKEQVAKLEKIIEDRVRDVRATFPASGQWMPDSIRPLDVALKKNKAGETVPVVKLATANYTFERGADGKALKRGTPEWNQRVEELAQKGAAEMLKIVGRTDPTAAVIMDQIGWYKDMVVYLRNTFGGMSDYFADFLGTFSPITQMKQTWDYSIEALHDVMRGKHDKLLSELDQWVKGGKTVDAWKKAKKPLIMRGEGAEARLFGVNSEKGMMAMLDLWRDLKEGGAPKARNFTMNFAGLSYRATIDRWAARFLQRMHAPNLRVPTLVEGAVTGKHMTGENAHLVTLQFGIGQDTFARMVDILKQESPAKFGELTPADLQAMLWFAEKEVWERAGWTPVQGAESSAMAMAEAEGVQRFEVGISRDRTEAPVTTSDQVAHGIALRNKINSQPHVLAAKVQDTVGMFKRTVERSFDTEILAYPDFDPAQTVADLVHMAGTSNQDATFISRAILDPDEDNPNARPGLTVFFREQVSATKLRPILTKLKALGLDGFTLQIDPRAKADLTPNVRKGGVRPNQFSGVRLQFIPEFSENPELDMEKAAKAMVDANAMLQELTNIAYINNVRYDTLVLSKGEYDQSGSLKDAAAIQRAEVWRGRSRDAGAKAADKRNRARAALADKQQRDAELSGGLPEGEESEGEEPVTAAQAQPITHEDETRLLEDPHTGGTSMARAMAQQLRDSGGNRVESRPVSFGAVSDLGRRSAAGGTRKSSVWKTLGRTFRSRESALHRSAEQAHSVLQRLNPGASGYQLGQKLFDYINGAPVDDVELSGYIDKIRERVPVVPQNTFSSLPQFEVGQEARVFHDAEAGVVYKLFKVEDGKAGAFVPGQLRLGGDNQIRISKGARPSFQEFLARVDRVNSQGSLTPMEFVATTTGGDAVFAQPYVSGIGVSDRNAASALKRLDLGMLTQIGGTAALGKVDGKWVLFDDLHSGNVRTAPGGKVEVIDAINRELTPDEVDDLGKLGKLPDVPDSITAAQAQSRAAVGGEVGANKEWYKGGQFIAKTDMPKKLREAIRKAATGREQFEVGYGGDKWSVPEAGMFPILQRLQGGGFDYYTGKLNPITIEYGKIPPEWVAQAEKAGKEWMKGERFLPVAEYPLLGNYADAARMIEAGQSVPAELLEKMPQNVRDQLTRAAQAQAPKIEPVTHFENATITAPMVQAHHGTPHEVDAFSTEKIGTGEGAQVYGWGLYFAENRDVAEAYRNNLGLYRAQLDGREVDENTLKVALTQKFGSRYLDGVIRASGIVDHWLKRAEAKDSQRNPYPAGERADFWNELNSRAKLVGKGNTYTVSLDLEPEDLLDWDKPLSEQEQFFNAVLKKLGVGDKDSLVNEVQKNEELAGKALEADNMDSPEQAAWEAHHKSLEYRFGKIIANMNKPVGTYGYDVASKQTGMALYDELRSLLKSPQKASDLLMSIGIPGIRYLDQGSRDTRPPYRGDTAFLHAAKAFKDDGYTPANALDGMLKAYEKAIHPTERDAARREMWAAIEEVYDIQPKQTYNYVVFDGKHIKITGKNGEPVGTIADAAAQPITAALAARQKIDTKASMPEEERAAQTSGQPASGGQVAQELAKSKARDDKGHLLTLYHGGGNVLSDISDNPNRGGLGSIYFTVDREVAERYALGGGIDWTKDIDEYRRLQKKLQPKRTPVITEAHLDIRNPLDLDQLRWRDIRANLGIDKLLSKIGDWSPSTLEKWEFEHSVADTDLAFEEWVADNWDDLAEEGLGEGHTDFDAESLRKAPPALFLASTQLLREYAAAVKADGIVYVDAEAQAETWVPFSKNQVHLVTPDSSVPSSGAPITAAQAQKQLEPDEVPEPDFKEQPVQDGTDIITAPLAAPGKLRRFWFGGDVPGSGYVTGGLFTARGQLNTQIWNALRTKTQNGRAIMLEADWLAKKFTRSMKEAYGKAGPTDAQKQAISMALGNTDNRLTDAQNKQAEQIKDPKLKAQYIAAANLQNVATFKVQQQAALASLPDAVRDHLVEMRDLLDAASANLAKDGGLSTDLKAAITDNMGVYLHRSYKIFEKGDQWTKFLESQNPEARAIIARARTLFDTYARAQLAKDFAVQAKKAGSPITRAQARAYAVAADVTKEVDTLLEDYKRRGDQDSTVNLLAGRLPGSAGQAIITSRGHIPKEIRELWGEWKDPAINFMRSYTSAATFLEDTKFQNEVLTHGLNNGYMWKEGSSKGPRPANWVLVAGGAKSMGALADVYGPEELALAFQTFNSPHVQDTMSKFISSIVAIPLAAKTVGSVGGTVRNFFGNIAFVVAQGNVFQGSALNSATTVGAKLAKMGSDERQAYIRELVSLGLVGEDVNKGMIDELAGTLQAESIGVDMGEGIAQKSWNITKSLLAKTAKGAGDVYGGVDDFWKIYSYEAELSKLKRAYRGDPAAPSAAEIKKQAADIVRKTLPTYSEAPAIMRQTKSLGRIIAPFILFKTEVIRVSAGTLHQAWTEVRSSNPKIKRIGAQRFAGATVAAAMPILIASVSKLLWGYDDDDEDTIRDSLPQFQKNATLLFLPKDEKGNPRYLDLSYMNPYNTWHAPLTAAARAGKQDRSGTAALSFAVAGGAEFLKPFVGEQLAVSALVDVARNQDSRSNYKPLYNTQDTFGNKTKAVIERLYHTVSPGTADSIERIYNAAVGNVPRSGMPLDLRNEIMSPILGTKIATYDRMKGLAGQTANFEAKKLEANALFTGPFNSRGTVAEGTVADAYRQANEARKALYRKMRKNYLGALKLGLKPEVAKRWMVIGSGSEFNKKGLSGDDINSVIRGKYRRYEASKASLTEQQKLNPERVKEYREAMRGTPATESIVD